MLCPICGKSKYKTSKRCLDCYNQSRRATGIYRSGHLMRECPRCGGSAHKGSSLCKPCDIERRRTGRRCEVCGSGWCFPDGTFCARCEKQSKCTHHWDLDSSNHGTCRKCKLQRQFPTERDISKLLEAKVSHCSPLTPLVSGAICAELY